MSWTSIDKDGQRMWERSDGVVAHGYQIKYIEDAENEAREQSMERMRLKREQWDLERQNEERKYEPENLEPMSTVEIIICIVALVFFVRCLILS